jgi:hypothetical protein
VNYEAPAAIHVAPGPLSSSGQGLRLIDDAQLVHCAITVSGSVKAVHISDIAVECVVGASAFSTPQLHTILLTLYTPQTPQECLCLVEKRETRYRVQWYYRLFEETQRGLTRAPSLDAVHGSLLALGELLRHTGAD